MRIRPSAGVRAHRRIVDPCLAGTAAEARVALARAMGRAGTKGAKVQALAPRDGACGIELVSMPLLGDPARPFGRAKQAAVGARIVNL